MSTIETKSSHVIVVFRKGRRSPVEMAFVDRVSAMQESCRVLRFYMRYDLEMNMDDVTDDEIRRHAAANLYDHVVWSKRIPPYRWAYAVHVDGSIPREALSVSSSDRDIRRPFVITSNGEEVEYMDASPYSMEDWALAE